jgi:transposase-like protein
MASKHRVSAASCYLKTKSFIAKLPQCLDLTRMEGMHYCGVLILDGKYVHVKGYKDKIPMLFAIDYLTHDIIHCTVAPAENYHASLSFFQSIRLANYPLKALVCDDNINFQMAARRVYPKSLVQICHNHHKENIRRQLRVRSDPTYVPFMREIEFLFGKRRSYEEFFNVARKILLRFPDPKCQSVLLDIERRKDVLLAHVGNPEIPRTNNLIECFNSHLEARLKDMKGFESMAQAKLWANAYCIHRRFKAFTGCTKPFAHLNTKASIQVALQNQIKFQKLQETIQKQK